MFNFNQALKEKEEREEAARDRAAAETAAKTRNMKDLEDGLNSFFRSRNFDGSAKLHGHKLIVDTKLKGSLSVAAEDGNRFTILPENNGMVQKASWNIPQGIGLSAQDVTNKLVEWIVPKS